jgi:transcriptional regulator with XRE-family HTH domain
MNQLSPSSHRWAPLLARRARVVAMDVAHQRLVQALGEHAPSESTLYRWERGEGAPSALLWPHLARAYGCSVDELLEGPR